MLSIAMLVMVLSGLLMWKRDEQPAAIPVVQTVQTAAVDDVTSRSLEDSNPWQS